YTTNVVFYWKLIFLLLAAADLLYLTVWPAAWKTDVDTPTHVRERAIGAAALVSFVAVMDCGRMLPFLGNSFSPAMPLGLTVVLVNFGIILVIYLLGRLIDGAAERYDSRKDHE